MHFSFYLFIIISIYSHSMKISKLPVQTSPKTKYNTCSSYLLSLCGDTHSQMILEATQRECTNKQQKISLRNRQNKKSRNHHLSPIYANRQLSSFKSCDKIQKQEYYKNYKQQSLISNQICQNTSVRSVAPYKHADIAIKPYAIQQEVIDVVYKNQLLNTTEDFNRNYQDQFQKILFQSNNQLTTEIYPTERNPQKIGSIKKTLHSLRIFDSQSLFNSQQSSLKSSVFIAGSQNEGESLLKGKSCRSIVDLQSKQLEAKSIIFDKQQSMASFRNLYISPSKR